MTFKRFSAILLALALLLTFSGCSRKHGVHELPPETESGLIVLPTSVPTDEPGTADPTAAPVVTSAPTAAPTPAPTDEPTPAITPAAGIFDSVPVTEDGIYDSKLEVAHYLVLFGHLPSNYITKKQAQSLGWTGGSLEPYAPGKCIGGDYFGNYEHQLPTKKGRTYHECDIGTLGRSSRGAKRLVYSNDGLIYYTGDHYDHFTLIYGGGN